MRYFFFPDLTFVHMYPVNLAGIWIRNFFNSLSRMEIFEYAMNPESCGR